MPINISVKKVPDEIMAKLRQRAKRHHRSLQGELMSILEQAAEPTDLSFERAEAYLKTLKLTTGDESAVWLKELRHAR